MDALPQYAKPSLDIEQQLELLIRRGIVVDDMDFARHALGHVSYYRLSAYSYPFRSREIPDAFVEGTTFAKVWRHYRFDRRLKVIVLDAIERVEIAVRTKLVNLLRRGTVLSDIGTLTTSPRQPTNSGLRLRLASTTARQRSRTRNSWCISAPHTTPRKDCRCGWPPR